MKQYLCIFIIDEEIKGQCMTKLLVIVSKEEMAKLYAFPATIYSHIWSLYKPKETTHTFPLRL